MIIGLQCFNVNLSATIFKKITQCSHQGHDFFFFNHFYALTSFKYTPWVLIVKFRDQESEHSPFPMLLLTIISPNDDHFPTSTTAAVHYELWQKNSSLAFILPTS